MRHCEPKEEIAKSCVEVVHDIVEFALAFQLNYPDTTQHLIETLKIVINLIFYLVICITLPFFNKKNSVRS